jgi:thymidylate kinase
MHYLSVYSKQPKWHKQVDWLLQTWNEGLNEFFVEEKTAREMIIMDLFDCIQNQEYATLKYINGYPEQLPVTSDIDMVTTRAVDKTVVAMLRKHKLVSKITYFRKSFMNTIQVTTSQGDILSIDLIWQLKVKNYNILNARKIIKDSYRNFFGVKAASIIDSTRFIAMFYVLNGAKIPKKYRVYEQVLAKSDKPLDLLLQNCFRDKKRGKKSVVSYLLKNKQNQKMRYIKNTLFYIADSVKGLLRGNGFTITFSGVDGAGKSTIIENAKVQIEKQLRKPVVILRHRPSILPILSAWTKGKEKAHSDVMANLPRQGNNTSYLSSLLRFCYYYTDYLLGQFVIYFKYVLRGKVVIYDRYYFDFINDSKRSNIVLPKFISQLGYAFLLKPEFNFFLFADAETILNRKQELNKSTIEKLTKEYNSLFEKLQLKSERSTYRIIKNDQIDTTINQVLTTIKHV